MSVDVWLSFLGSVTFLTFALSVVTGALLGCVLASAARVPLACRSGWEALSAEFPSWVVLRLWCSGLSPWFDGLRAAELAYGLNLVAGPHGYGSPGVASLCSCSPD